RHTRSYGDWSSDVCSSDLPALASAHRAFNHGVHDLQMGRIERERDMHRPAPGGEVGRKAVVVLHVARGQLARCLAFEFQKQVLRSEERRVGKECGARWALE